jgi:large subunit ribosomal protein L6e
MANFKINNLKVANPTINKILREDRYDTEDVTKEEMSFVLKHAPAPRVARIDLIPGNLVVVLEGCYTGKRVVFIKQLPGNLAVCSGISSINGVSLFKIDERFLFKLSSSVEIPSKINLNLDNVFESKIFEGEKVDVELSAEEKSFEELLLTSVCKVPFMKSYLADSFKVNNDVEFYSQKY